jgi:hypothetical protein
VPPHTTGRANVSQHDSKKVAAPPVIPRKLPHRSTLFFHH